MGAGGIANIRATQASPIIKDKSFKNFKKLLPSVEYFDSDVLSTLFEGLRFNYIPNELRIDFLLAWHKSENADRAREAYWLLLECAKAKSLSMDNLHSTMKSLLKELNEFCINAEPSTEKAYDQAQKKQNVISGIATVGGIACTVAGVFLLDILMAVSGLGFTWIGIREWSTREKLIEELLKRHAPNVHPELYKRYRGLREFSEDFFRRIRHSANINNEQHDNDSTSIPVRTIWWTD